MRKWALGLGCLQYVYCNLFCFVVASFFIVREFTTTDRGEKSLSNSNESVQLSAAIPRGAWQMELVTTVLSPGGRTASSLGDFPHPAMTLWQLNCHFCKSCNTLCRGKVKKNPSLVPRRPWRCPNRKAEWRRGGKRHTEEVYMRSVSADIMTGNTKPF